MLEEVVLLKIPCMFLGVAWYRQHCFACVLCFFLSGGFKM